MKALEAAVVTQQDAAKSRPVLLFTLGLDVGSLRFCATRENVTFPAAGNVYTAKAVELGNIKQSRGNQISKITVAFDDVAKDMSGYNNAEKFEGKTLAIWKVYRDAFGAANLYNELFFGYMLEPKNIDDRWMMVDIVAGSILQERNLLQYFQETCNHQFGDAQCDLDGFASLAALTVSDVATGGTTGTLIDTVNLTQASDHWNYGRIEIIKAGIRYYRDIIDSDFATETVTFDVELPVTVAAGDAYTIYKGCSNTWNACQQNEAWGPSADNKLNFLGFIHLGDQLT